MSFGFFCCVCRTLFLIWLRLAVINGAAHSQECDGAESVCAVGAIDLENIEPGLSLLQKTHAGLKRSPTDSTISHLAVSRSSNGGGQLPLFPFCPKQAPVEDFNLTEYSRASWYSIEQQTTAYQSEDQLKCVVATYNLNGTQIPFNSGPVVDIYNYWEGGQRTANANGDPVKPDPPLCGAVVARPGSLKVGPCNLPAALGGDYWVLDIGKSKTGEYEWATVSGGKPTVKYRGNPSVKHPDGCTTNAGLWIFSRTPTLSYDTLFAIYDSLNVRGWTLSQLRKVNQTGCTYDGAYIKP